ncbi:MAG: alpha/beta hydrolase [Phenylobacterium sp.]|uniref:hypothetical protein n=1 Tax=Phenylobacterium sp. TaxID=1871053 RepID=UPI0025FAC16F|nr:hypothetical protein [Phenylobacterium sp.]MBI1197203.1 alpha/beta hydrolase [Phenylobacterium sp.]
MARLVLIPSPFVGGSSWAPTAAVLPDALVAGYGGVCGPAWYEGVADRVCAQADGRPWIAVLHSGAGGFAPALAAASADLAGFIFADAVLPYPGRSNLATAPEAFADELRRLTTDGLLAPWDQWFAGGFLEHLIPDAATRAAFVADIPRVPFAFLEAVAPDDGTWAERPCAYLQLSRTYAGTADRAEAMGWPVRRERMHHLAMTTAPREVAALLLELVGRLDG